MHSTIYLNVNTRCIQLSNCVATPYEPTFSIVTRRISFRQRSLSLAVNIQNDFIFTNQGFQRDIQLTNRNVAVLAKKAINKDGINPKTSTKNKTTNKNRIISAHSHNKSKNCTVTFVHYWSWHVGRALRTITQSWVLDHFTSAVLFLRKLNMLHSCWSSVPAVPIGVTTRYSLHLQPSNDSSQWLTLSGLILSLVNFNVCHAASGWPSPLLDDTSVLPDSNWEWYILTNTEYRKSHIEICIGYAFDRRDNLLQPPV